MTSFAAHLCHELRKLFARKRTHLGFGVFLAVESVLLFLLQRPHSRETFRRLIEGRGKAFDEYFSGVTLGLQIVSWTGVLLGTLFVALVSADIVAKEVEDGTLRMTLCRPVSRARICVVKYLSCAIYVFALTAFLGATALLGGVLCRGMGGLFVCLPPENLLEFYPLGEGITRFGTALSLLALGLTGAASIGFMFSCFAIRPVAATIATVAVLFIDLSFRAVSYFALVHPFLLASHMGAWRQVFLPAIPWDRIRQDCAWLLAVDVACFAIGLSVFNKREMKG
jgi:ABC-2 type transport system permease protein